MPSRRGRDIALGTVLALAYFGAARLGLTLDAVSGFASLVWPATGLALAAVLVLGRKLWPAIAAGAFLANLTAGAHPLAAAAIGAGNTLEAVVGSVLLERAGFRLTLERLRDVILLVVLGAFGGTMISATIGVTTLLIADTVKAPEFWTTWLAWWQGDMLGALVVAPFLLVLARTRPLPATPARLLEGAMILAADVLATLVSFRPRMAGELTRFPRLYLAFPILLWGAVRFGQLGATTVTLVTAAVAIAGVVSRGDPYMPGELSAVLSHLQIYIAILALTGLTLAAIDSERRNASEELRQAHRGLEEVVERRTTELRSKDEFLAMLSHELRNPLASTMSAVSVLQSSAGSPAERRRAIEVIDHQTQNMRRLVDDLLDVARVTRGKITLKRGEVDLERVVARAVGCCRSAIDEKSHELAVDVGGPRVFLDGDAPRIEQMLVNLLGNAAKYTPPRGRISVVARIEGDEAVIRVADNGIGIDPALLERIFDPFVQGDQSLARSEGGLGVGLTLVRKLAELHGGSVSASSAGPGTGSEFVVRLPVGKVTTRESTAAKPGPVAANPATASVLVVDDNEDAAEMTRVLLGMWGYRVHSAPDGLAAIVEARGARPSIVLLDIGLPGIDGFETARRLRAELGPAALLVAVTGYGREEDRARAEAAGFDEFLLKPVPPDRLREVVDRHVRDGGHARRA